ncbi:MAG TPA: SDR family oxidoreductase [Sunxiuqinia sp.]|nr:SDR family oxidoreductase [Sunxiuqinia sp.]
MKLFLTGATGFIGSQLALKLANAGHEVHVLYRNPQKLKDLEHVNLHFFKGDLFDKAALKDAMEGCDGVFHLAAFARLWAKDPSTYYKVNVEGTQNVLETAIQCKVKRIVLTSTAGVFGPSENSTITEDTKRSLPFFNDYEETKTNSDEQSLKAAQGKIDVVIVHPTRVYGPGLLSESNGVTRMVKMYLGGKFKVIPGDGKSVGNYVYIDDVVDGHIKAFEKGRPGERYLLGGENVSFDEFFSKLAQLTKRHYRMAHLPLFVLNIVASFFEIRTKLFGTAPLITAKWVKRYLYHWEVSSQKALEELNYQPINLEEGMKRTIAWIQNEV